MTLRRLAVNAASLAGGGIVAQLCFITIEALVARRLGPDSYGAYGTVYALTLTVVVLAEMGTNWKLIEDGSRDRAAIPRLLGTTLVLRLVLCTAIYPLALMILPVVGYGPTVVGFFAVFFGFGVLLSVQETFAAVYAAHQRMHVSALFQGLSPFAILMCVAVATQWSPTLEAIGASYIVGAAVVTVVWAWRTFAADRPRVDLRQVIPILRGSYLYGISATLYQINQRIDVIMLALWRDLGEVALFAAADKLADFGFKVGHVISRVLAPMLYEQSHHDVGAYRRSCKMVLRGISVFGVMGCLTLAFLAEPLVVTVFGESFRVASTVLVLLALSLSARLSVLALQMILSASGEHARRTASLALSCGIAVSANVVLIPPYGIVGAAIGRTLTDLILVSTMLGGRNLPIHRGAAASWSLAPLVLGAVVFLAVSRIPVHFALQLAIALVVYSVGLLATRMIRLEELRAFVDSIRPKTKR